MKKRILSLLLCLCLCAGLFPGAALASGEPAEETPAVEEDVADISAMEEIPAAEEPVPVDGDSESYTVTMVVVYPEDYEGERTGGLRVYDQTAENAPGVATQDFSVYTDYVNEMTTPVTRGEGETFWYSTLPVDGLTASTDLSSGGFSTSGYEYTAYRGEAGMDYTITVTYGESSSSGEMGGPTAASKSFFVTLDITYPEGYEDDGYVVYQVDKDDDFAALDERYKDGDTIEISAGEWALFGYEEINGETAAWQGSTMQDGLYGLANEPRDEGETVTLALVYGEDAGSDGPSGGSTPEISGEDYEVSLSIEYNAEYTGEKSGGITLYNEEGTASAVYTENAVIQMEGGVECRFIPIAVDGLYAFVTGAEKSGDYYVIGSSGEVVIQYDDSPFYIETKDMAADGSTVGSTSAVLTAIYSAPSDTSATYYRMELVFGVDKSNMTTYGRYVGGHPGGEAYLEEYSQEIKGLLPNTTYYYQAYMVYREGTDDPERTIYGEIKTFTTDMETIPCYEVAPINWTADVQEIPCSVTDSADATNTDLGKLVFTAGDKDRGSYLLSFTVDKTGTYHFDATYNGVIESESRMGVPNILMVRLYTKDDAGGLVTDAGGGIDKEICYFFLNGNGGNEEHTEKYVDLEAGVEYYLLLDTDGETVDISVSYANWVESDAQFDLNVTVAYEKNDSRPACMRALAVYSVSEYYGNGYTLRGTYGLSSVYEENGTMPYTMSQLMGGLTSEQTDALMRGWMNYCIPGLEYVYELYIVDDRTGAVLATSGVQSFTANMPDMYSLQLGENINTYEDWKFGHEGYMYKLQTGVAGYYHIGVNDNDSVVEFYNAQGELLKRSTSGSFWSSVSCELEGDTLYYVYISCNTEIKPIVTVSQPNGAVATDDSVVTADDESADTARETLEDVLDQLTKDGSGNAAELPDYVEADATGETALRTAIETGETLTAEITGETVDENDVDAETAAGMEEAVLEASGSESAEAVVYLELAVILKDGETELARVTETTEEITFAIPLTDELRAQIDGKTVYVVREHEGVTETLETVVSEEDGYIYFSSSLFSTFALFTAGELLNGFVEEDGVLYYYVDGVRFKGGLFEEDGEFYYARTTNGEIVRGRNYWVTCANTETTGYASGYYAFDEEGKMIRPDVLNGFVEESGVLYYYVDGERFSGGLFEVDGEFYYARTSSGEIVRSRGYWVTCANTAATGYVSGYYTFDSEGRMIRASGTTGFVEEDGVLYYYVDGERSYGGLFELDGAFYYARTTNGEIVRSRSYWITCTNGLLPQGLYVFDESGKMAVD